MKKAKPIIAAIVLAAALVAPGASAEVTCRKDFLGNYVCNGMDSRGNRYNSTTRRDFLGNDVTTGTYNGRHFRQTCRTDFLGNYVCR